MPRYLARSPYHPITNPADGIDFTEEFDLVGKTEEEIMAQYPWASSAMLFARNMVKSYETSGWCQYLRGVKGGGLCKGLATHTFNVRGEDELRGPVEISLPDFREYQLAKAGIIPLIHKKGSSEAVFYSAQALKRPLAQEDPKDAENQQLASNLTYTFSVSRIAHYLKLIMRDNIGSSADATYIATQIDRWISRYVTTIVNPDDLTLRYYPFKAYSLEVTPVAGQIGWYKCNLSILPHIQFEGMDVDLRVDARLGA
jgi:type VI secretion system protein ImpC